MGTKYVREEDTFNTSQNGTVPKPTGAEVSANKYLRADGSWQSGVGGSVVSADQIVTSGTEIGGVTIDGNRTAFYAPGQTHTYSTSEKVYGTWIDGKTIYETTWTNLNKSISTGYSRSGIIISTLSTIISAEAIDQNGQYFPITLGIYSNNELALSASTPVTDLKTLTVRYTKTT